MTPTKAAYDAAFKAECAVEYPVIDAFEKRCGFAIDRKRLEDAARVLACPVKVNPPNWQHGRILYAAACEKFVRQSQVGMVSVVDVGTAKGFSALVMLWAAMTASVSRSLISLDVINPDERRYRNSVAEAEADGPLTLAEVLAPWPESWEIHFKCSGGADWLGQNGHRIHFAFLDGKHAFSHVDRELFHLTRRQAPGDVVVLDDLQVPGVREAVVAHRKAYSVETIVARPNRIYGVATRR